jgi:glycosyltransferase involved in cell wall biosynthesis
VAYAASLALWQGRLARLADAVIVPSAFARERLRELGAPLAGGRVHVLPPPVVAPREPDAPAEPAAARGGGYALVVSRLAPEKGVDVAVDACRLAGVTLVVAGDGPARQALQARAESRPRPAEVRFLGRVEEAELARLRAGAAVALAPSRSAETFGLAAAEAMAAGVPVVASRVGALSELVPEEGLVAPDDPIALAEAIERLWRDEAAAARARRRIALACSPETIATRLGAIYDGLPADRGLAERARTDDG